MDHSRGSPGPVIAFLIWQRGKSFRLRETFSLNPGIMELKEWKGKALKNRPRGPLIDPHPWTKAPWGAIEKYFLGRHSIPMITQ